MKYCPSCGTQYTDDTLRFCLQDGSQLTPGRESEARTVVLDETPTLTRNPVPAEVTRTGAGTSSEIPLGKSRSLLGYFLIAGVAGAMLFVAGVAAAWFLFSGLPAAGSNNIADAGNVSSPAPGNANRILSTPGPRSSATADEGPSPRPTEPPTTPQVAINDARTAVSQVIQRWKSSAEDLDLNSYMSNYAQKVDYYNRSGASRSVVRSDKARAFRMYNSISISLSNLNISFGGPGEIATAEFDKEWDFRGSRSSSGKVRTELRLRLEDGQWLIIGERDIRVYFVN